MSYTKSATTLTHEATMVMLAAAIAKAEEIGQPQNVVIVDASGVELGKIRMSGAKFLSLKSAHAKAVTSASIRVPSTSIPDPMRGAISTATEGNMTHLPGGLPIILDGECVGAVGVGSGSGEQDVIVATAALAAIGAKIDF